MPVILWASVDAAVTVGLNTAAETGLVSGVLTVTGKKLDINICQEFYMKTMYYYCK